MKYSGQVWKYGDDINTDVLYPGRYTYQLLSPEETASHALEDLDPEFVKKMKPGDILVGGRNWGVGSAREQAVKALKYKGVKVIIAESFARIYFRNCLNEGVLAIVCPAAAEAVSKGEVITVDMQASVVETERGNFPFERYPEYVMGLVEQGGIIPYTKQLMAKREKQNG